MRTRVLPPEEWPKLPPEAQQIPGLRPEDVSVVVVESDGEIVAAMTVLRATHWEGAWVAPQHRNAGVVRGLLGLSAAVASCWGSSWVFAGAADDRMRDVLGRLGAKRVPMDTFMLGLGGEACRPPQSSL